MNDISICQRELDNFLVQFGPESAVFNAPRAKLARMRQYLREHRKDGPVFSRQEWMEYVLACVMPSKDCLPIAQTLAAQYETIVDVDEKALRRIRSIPPDCRDMLLKYIALCKAYINARKEDYQPLLLDSFAAFKKHICETFMPEDMYPERGIVYFLDDKYQLRMILPLCDGIAWGEDFEIARLLDLIAHANCPNMAILLITPGRSGRPDDYEWGHLDLLYNMLLPLEVHLVDILFVGNDVYSMSAAGELESYRRRVERNEIAPVYPYFDLE